MLDQIMAAQRWIYSSLSSDLSAFAGSRNWIALSAVLPLGILFGALHALTPGHGKAVLASYLVGAKLTGLRATGVAAILSLTHVGSAVILALLFAPLITRTLGGAGRAPALEALSRGLLVGLGIWLLLRALFGRAPHSHSEGLVVGLAAGLVPCPLTLFAMFFALSRGVPEAGITFAAAMMLGIALTLSAVALAAVLARQWVLRVISHHGASLARASRFLDATAGVLLIGVAGRELWLGV
jgi:ABC-type nickel/cobalt efflux system permease component RcnA